MRDGQRPEDTFVDPYTLNRESARSRGHQVPSENKFVRPRVSSPSQDDGDSGMPSGQGHQRAYDTNASFRAACRWCTCERGLARVVLEISVPVSAPLVAGSPRYRRPE